MNRALADPRRTQLSKLQNTNLKSPQLLNGSASHFGPSSDGAIRVINGKDNAAGIRYIQYHPIAINKYHGFQLDALLQVDQEIRLLSYHSQSLYRVTTPEEHLPFKFLAFETLFPDPFTAETLFPIWCTILVTLPQAQSC